MQFRTKRPGQFSDSSLFASTEYAAINDLPSKLITSPNALGNSTPHMPEWSVGGIIDLQEECKTEQSHAATSSLDDDKASQDELGSEAVVYLECDHSLIDFDSNACEVL